MLASIAKTVFGSSNDRYVRSIRKIVERINAYELNMQALTDAELAAQTDVYRDRLKSGETLEDLLPEAFATVREASVRVLGMRHFDVQMIGGVALHRGEIAEMATGEGKTLVATLPAYLNALAGRGVHVVSVNDYLVRRDAEWMGRVYTFLGLTVGVIVPNLGETERRAAYACDITYGTNNEYGFDYLRDNMKYDRLSMTQRDYAYAIIDEVDSVLIDEARTPLIISGPTDDKSELYMKVNEVVKLIPADDYEVDEKQKSIILTEDGTESAERALETAGLLEGTNLYDFENTQVVHHLNQALRANALFKRDIDYIVKDGKVIIIDEFTGRMMDGRRWSDGLHQAVEAKEGVEIEPENQTLASITFQNYFRMYDKLSGMTGTAATEAAEFFEIYKMNVVSIPTNRPIDRTDEEDTFYKSMTDKFAGIAATIKEHADRGQPVLVGTVSIEKSELLSEFLTKEGVPHAILNARQHEREAHIVAQAGRAGTVTIATNMAGRGTDIQLGGNLEFRIGDELAEMDIGPERDAAIERIKQEIAAEKERVKEAGGLFVLGTERHESRRIDNQLRGRSGRQGDPGLSRFYLSLDDDLLRIFGPDTMFSKMMRANLEDGEALPPSRWMTKAIETAQKKVERRNYDIRKQVVEYDDVMNDQRKVIYEQREDIIDADELDDIMDGMRSETVETIVQESCPPGTYPEQWNVEQLKQRVTELLALDSPIDSWLEEDAVDPEMLVDRLQELSDADLAGKVEPLPAETWRAVQKSILLQQLDHHWKEHLSTLDALRQVIHLRAYAQKTPINEYKHEAFALFERMLAAIREDTTRVVSNARFELQAPPELPRMPDFLTTHFDPLLGEDDTNDVDGGTMGLVSTAFPPPRQSPIPSLDFNDDGQEDADVTTVSRNSPCPCGSGRKYKHCHGALTG